MKMQARDTEVELSCNNNCVTISIAPPNSPQRVIYLTPTEARAIALVLKEYAAEAK